MKKIKDIKKEARKPLKFHYWHAILISFLITIVLNGGAKYNTALLVDNNSTVNNAISNIEILESFLDNFQVNNILKKISLFRPTRGVFSVVFNNISSTGSITFGTLNAINKTIFEYTLPSVVILIINMLVFIFSLIFIQNILVVGKNRYFLERRKFKNTHVDKIFFVYRIKKTMNVAKIMLKKFIYQFLWDLTIIGGIIKHYEYLMIPYILAENPEIDSKECFLLSKKMTDGKKLRLFYLEFSFIGWYILGAFTFSLTNIFFYYPYMESVYAEVYMELRNDLLKENKILEIYFKDKYLDLNNKEIYPGSLYFIPESKRRNWLSINYKRNYSIENLILIFFAISILGWIWEVSLHFVGTGNFVNRGTMLGPWLPIYGYGTILILILLKKYRSKPHMLFIMSFLVCGLVEYLTSWYLEFFKNLRWWDYSGYFININGRVCLEGLLFFALGGYVITYFIAPLLDTFFNKIPKNKKLVIVIILLSLYMSDLVYSHFYPNIGEGITSEKKLEVITKGVSNEI